MRIYVHGNCQAPALADLIGQACGAAVDVISRQVYSIDLEAEGAAHINDVQTADVILTQPVAEGYRGTDILSTSWMRAHARKDAIFLVFPVIYHRGLLPQCYTLGDFHDGRLAYHDAHAVDYFLMGEDADSFVRATNRSDFLPESFVLSELSRTTLELLRRERALGVDVPVSDIIATRLTTGQPMYTVNHPSRSVMTDLANRVLERLGRTERASADGIDMLDLFIMPPYLSTALALGHSGTGVWLDDMSADGVMETRLDFFRQVFQAYEEIGRDRLRQAIAENPEITGYLARYEHAKFQGSSRDMSDLVDVLYKTFLDRPAAPDEILHHLQTVRLFGFTSMVSAFASSPDFHARGGAASMMNRFPVTNSMPVRRPHVRIPHPGQLTQEITPISPTTEPAGLKVRLQRLWRAIVNAPPEAESSKVDSYMTFPVPGAAGPDDISTGQAAANLAPSNALSVEEKPMSPADLPLIIAVPMAGHGSRFSEAGYLDPKPLINVFGQPMIKLVIDNLTPRRPHRFVFICQSDHIQRYQLADKLDAWAPGCAVVAIDGVTEGAACTVLAAREFIGDGPLMIANSDQYVEISIDDYLLFHTDDVDGLIMTMTADDPKWSYAGLGPEKTVTRVVEKEVISDQATVGIYNFARGSDFVRGAEQMIAKDKRVNGEFYVAPVYNELIEAGARVVVYNIGPVGHQMHGLGTPADLDAYLQRCAQRPEAVVG